LAEAEELREMFGQVLEKMNEDSQTQIHLSLNVLYNLFLAFEEHSADQEFAK
jgi:hypothetical protein